MAIASSDLKVKKWVTKRNSRLLFLLSGIFLGGPGQAASLSETNHSTQTEATIQITKGYPSLIEKYLPQTGEERVWFALLLGLLICLLAISYLRQRQSQR